MNIYIKSSFFTRTCLQTKVKSILDIDQQMPRQTLQKCSVSSSILISDMSDGQQENVSTIIQYRCVPKLRIFATKHRTNIYNEELTHSDYQCPIPSWPPLESVTSLDPRIDVYIYWVYPVDDVCIW